MASEPQAVLPISPSRTWSRGWITAGILVCYLASFPLPAITGYFETTRVEDTAIGGVAFVLGLVLFPVCTVLWLANPLMWIGLAAFRRGKLNKALAFGIAASVCALGTLAIPNWKVGVGYFLWLGSMCLLTSCAVIARKAGGPVSSNREVQQ
jgi:hypothetical protein